MDRTNADKASEINTLVPPARRRRRIRLVLSLSCWLYFAIVIAFWLFIRIAGDRWWPATVCLFGPRWILLFPLVPLVPLAARLYRRWLWGLLAIALIVAWPMMDLRITLRGVAPEERNSSTLRVLTLNSHFTTTDPDRLKALIDQTQPDIIAMQEWYPGNRIVFLSEPKWHTIQSPEAMLASPYPIQRVGRAIGESDITAGVSYRYAIKLPSGSVTFYSVHLSSPHTVFRDVLHLQHQSRGALTRNSLHRRSEAVNIGQISDDDTILAGDFNLPRDSTIYRSAFSKLSDAFTDAGLGWGLTYYSQWTTVRIDHVLMGRNWRCTHCWVGPDVGSPHRPVIADLERSMK